MDLVRKIKEKKELSGLSDELVLGSLNEYIFKEEDRHRCIKSLLR